jgi:hypothetical protein
MDISHNFGHVTSNLKIEHKRYQRTTRHFTNFSIVQFQNFVARGNKKYDFFRLILHKSKFVKQKDRIHK